MRTEKPNPAAVTHRRAGGPTMPSNWCIDSDTVQNVIARRNALMALWAGRKIGIEEPAMSLYANLVHFSDHQVSGDADIVEKVCADFAARGIDIGEAEIRRKLWEFHKEALRQSSSTD